MKSHFDKLAEDLKGLGAETETLAKSFADKEKEDAAAGAEAGGDKDDAEIAEAAGEADAKKAKAEEGEAPLGKSFVIKLEDGTEVEAVDGADMIKSLVKRVEKTEADSAQIIGLAIDTIRGQGALIKSLSDRVDMLSNQARPRKATVSVSDRPAPVAELAKSEAPAGISSDALMAKSLGAQAAGRVTSLQIAVAEQQIQSGQQPDPEFVRAVMAE